MRIRTIALFAMIPIAGLTAAGCASVSKVLAPATICENPLIVPVNDFETVCNKTIAAVDEFFDIRSENRLSRTIVTDPVIGATVLEPWRRDSANAYDRLESTLQTIRRFARVQVEEVPGRGYSIKVEVLKELEFLARPDRAMAGRAVFNNDFPVNRAREIVGPVPAPIQWIPRGRDNALEQKILNKIRNNLFF